MDGSALILLTVVLSVLFLLIQRSDPKKRLIVIVCLLVVFELIRRFVWFRDWHAEGWTALGIALVLNFAFWLLIGRYNPPPSSDNIQVLGMDD